MPEVIISPELYIMDKHISVTVLKYLVDNGINDGFIPLKPLRVEIDGVHTDNMLLQIILPKKEMKIKVIQ